RPGVRRRVGYAHELPRPHTRRRSDLPPTFAAVSGGDIESRSRRVRSRDLQLACDRQGRSDAVATTAYLLLPVTDAICVGPSRAVLAGIRTCTRHPRLRRQSAARWATALGPRNGSACR